MNHNISWLRKVFVGISFFMSFFFVPSAFAGTTLLFSTEEPDGITSDSYSLDKDDSATTNIDLTFGSGTTNYLRFNKTLTQFEFNQNVSLGGKELKNFRIENAASAGTCDVSTKGRMYFDTDDNALYYCNGSAYISPSANIADDSIAGTKLADAVAGAGLIKDGSENLAVNTDGTTLEINGDAVRVKAGGIGANEIGTNAVAADELADNAVDSGAIANGAVTAGKIGVGGISASNQFGAGVVNSAAIGAGAVGSTQLANNSVDVQHLVERNATIVISPEFSKNTFNPDGTNNVGNMESGFDSVVNKNFYRWFSRNTSILNDYDIVLQWSIPASFTGWQASNQIQVDYKTDTISLADNKIDLILRDSTGANIPLTGGANLKSSVADTWISAGNVSFSGGTWTPGTTLTFVAKLSSKATGAADFNPAYLGPIRFNIKTK